MHEKDNYLKTAELSTEQNCNMIDGVPNNTPIPPTPPELDAKPLDKVKEPKEAGYPAASGKFLCPRVAGWNNSGKRPPIPARYV